MAAHGSPDERAMERRRVTPVHQHAGRAAFAGAPSHGGHCRPGPSLAAFFITSVASRCEMVSAAAPLLDKATDEPPPFVVLVQGPPGVS